MALFWWQLTDEGSELRKFQLVMLIHAHQPVGNFESVLEVSYTQCYLPYVELLEKHPAVRVGLHFSGCLLEWLDRVHPEYVARLRTMVERNQVEIVGGGFYEPVLISIPREDRQRQLALLADYVQEKLGKRPRGAWLTERVWEPGLPSSLAPAGVEYTLIDDNQFMSAGFEPQQLFGAYTAEDTGHVVKLIPGLKELRYFIPFHEPHETIAFLRHAAQEHPGGFAAIGDDYEKFGGWPETYKTCYTDGWLERFYTAIEENSDWLEMVPPGEAVDRSAPLGRADLPDASYVEMMEWALPTKARLRLQSIKAEFQSRPDVQQFLRGGTWRGFLTKYPESNLLHKKMLHVSAKVAHLDESRGKDEEFREARKEARTALLRGQCNDPYWHGVFGGLYSPHLRTAVWKALEEAETIAEGLGHRSRHYADVQELDFEGDGHQEIYFTSDSYAALLAPREGGTISALDFRPPNVTLVNSLQRRPEAYHAQLRNLPAKSSGEVQSIHDQTRTKEEGLERWLQYDRWTQQSFRLLLFGMGKTIQDSSAIHLEEDAALAAGRYEASNVSPLGATLTSCDSADWTAEKKLSLASTPEGFDIVCDVRVERKSPGTANVNIGVETIVNFLAPSSPDRYFESDGKRYPLRWTAAVPGPSLRVVDEWQRAAVALEAPGAQSFWVVPIETVSESEDGFERVYQGSKVIAVWPVELAPGAEWKRQLVFRVTQL